MDSYYPQNYNTVPCEGGGSSSVVWIILVILLLLAVIGLIIWLVLSYRRNPDDRKIEFAGANVEITSPTSITGTWNQTSSSDDVITLYATLDPPIYNSSGQVINTNAPSNNATGSQTSLIVSKLQAELKYYATMIVTNPGTSNFGVYTQIVYMPNADDTKSEFEMGHILQLGRIEIDDDGKDVFFNQAPATDATVLFTLNSSAQLENANNLCLYTDATTDTKVSKLLVAECDANVGTTTTPLLNSSNSHWIYNHNGLANRWCLNSTIGDTNPRCMVLQNITSNSAAINVSNASGAGDGWVNFKGFDA